MTNCEEIAARLRASGNYLDGKDTSSMREALYLIGLNVKAPQGKEFSLLFNRLADLIDPTCHIKETIEDGKTMYVCSNCNSCKSDDKDIFSQFNYCPVCGARVVRDDL